MSKKNEEITLTSICPHCGNEINMFTKQCPFCLASNDHLYIDATKVVDIDNDMPITIQNVPDVARLDNTQTQQYNHNKGISIGYKTPDGEVLFEKKFNECSTREKIKYFGPLLLLFSPIIMTALFTFFEVVTIILYFIAD